MALVAMMACSSSGDASLTSPPSRALETSTSVEATTTTAPVAAPSTAPGAEPCAPSSLAIEAGEGRSALGRGLYVFELRNTSARACQLLGTPAVVLLDAQGVQMALAAGPPGRLVTGRPATPVLLAAGASGYFGLEAATVCASGARPLVSASIRVTLSEAPGSTSVTVDASVPVCSGQDVVVSPVRASEAELTG